jgi:hypothetical protein
MRPGTGFIVDLRCEMDIATASIPNVPMTQLSNSVELLQPVDLLVPSFR